jgi:hypothetical protein
MRDAVTSARELLQEAFTHDPFTAGQMEQQALTKLLDVTLALDTMCTPRD